jgi:non-ribosomal peptide synthetase component F
MSAARWGIRPRREFAGSQLTYRELDRRANRLAHRAGPELRVGICVERSLEMETCATPARPMI